MLNSTVHYGTALFKLNRVRVQHGLDRTCFSFYTCASICVHTRLMMPNLLCKVLMYALDVYTIRRCVFYRLLSVILGCFNVTN